MHFSKASMPILVTLPGISTLARSLQYEKAFLPMLVTLPGISTLTR